MKLILNSSKSSHMPPFNSHHDTIIHYNYSMHQETSQFKLLTTCTLYEQLCMAILQKNSHYYYVMLKTHQQEYIQVDVLISNSTISMKYNYVYVCFNRFHAF